jgi:hypothetical protein
MKRIISSIIAGVLIASNVPLAAQGSSSAVDSSGRFVRSNQYWMAYAGKLPIGSTVRVRTTDGKRMTAVLAIVDDFGITLEPKTRIPERPMRVPYEQLDQLSVKENGSNVGKAVGIGMAVGVGAFLGLLAILASAWD